MIFPKCLQWSPQKHLGCQCWEWVGQGREMLLESIGCRPGLMPVILQCPGQPSNNKIWPPMSVTLRLRDPGPKWDWKMNAVLGETGSSEGDGSSVSRGKSYFKGESRLWWRMVQKSWLSCIRSRSILSLVRRRSFLTMVRLFLQNGSYECQMERTEGEVRSMKAACLWKGGILGNYGNYSYIFLYASYYAKCFVVIIQISPHNHPMKYGFLCVAEEIKVFRIYIFVKNSYSS